MSFSIACQTITFGPKQSEHFPAVFAAVKKAGYAGVEVGYRHLAHHPAAEIRHMLQEHGLDLAASHIGGNLEDTQQAASERGKVDEILDYLNAAGTTRLLYSGIEYKTEESFARNLDVVNRTAVKCQARGIQLLYHNHWYEFNDGWRGMNAILQQGADALGFCPDVGWVKKGGADALQFLERIKGRIGAVHYKDFLTEDVNARDFCILGRGVTPFEEVTRWLRTHTSGLWVIAEQDTADVPPEQAIAQNGHYLQTLFR